MRTNIHEDFVLGVWYLTAPNKPKRVEVILLAYRRGNDWHLHVYRPTTGLVKDINLKAYPTTSEVKRQGDDLMTNLEKEFGGNIVFKQVASPDPHVLYRTLRKIPGMNVSIRKGYLQ